MLVLAIASGAGAFPQAGKKLPAKRANELTIAGLRPGVDTLKRAQTLYRFIKTLPDNDKGFVLHQPCWHFDLFLETDAIGRIMTLRMAENDDATTCSWRGEKVPPGIPPTGRGLGLSARIPEVIHLYGEPTSRSPSAKNGQPLELLYYAFDWAGPDVPQVMEVVCTVPEDRTPGRVVEITLAAGSL